MDSEQIPLHTPAEALLVKVTLCNNPMLLLTVYRPPSSCDPLLLPSLFEEVHNIKKIAGVSLIVCGDFNLPSINWMNWTCSAKKGIVDPFLQTIAEMNLHQNIFVPTHSGGNTLDLIFTSTALIDDLQVLEPCISDHSIVVAQLNAGPETVNINKTRTVSMYSRADLDRAETVFEPYHNHILQGISNENPIDGIYNLFLRGCEEITSKCVPRRKKSEC